MSATEAIGDCVVEVVNALLSYGLDSDTIAGLCQAEEGAGCTSTQDCLNQYLVSSAGAAQERADEVGASLNVMFLLFSAFMVFMMQLGFATLTAGSIRSKNCMNILLKNVLDACVGAIGFYLLGFGFAYGARPGETATPFIGNYNFALSYTTSSSFSGDSTVGWHVFFFQWSFCAAATTIVSGAVAERCAFPAYLMYSFFLSSFVYPVVVHWVWDANGWLSAFNTSRDGNALILKTGAIDFAGSGVVHMLGGVAGLCGAAIIGPRVGRFTEDGRVNDIKGHSTTLVVMGTFLLWFGWFGFNPGSYLAIGDAVAAQVVARVAVCTALAGGAGGIAALLFTYFRTRTWDTEAVCNGVLSGLVAITAGCAVVEPWAAIGAGAIGGVMYFGWEHLVLHVMKIDDPVNVFAVHGGVGIWGVLFPAIMGAPNYVDQVYGGYGLAPVKEGKRYGLFYGGHAQLLLVNCIEVLVIIAWTVLMMGSFFFIVNKAGILRVSMEDEMQGLDVSHHSKYRGGRSPASEREAAMEKGFADAKEDIVAQPH